MRRNNRLGGLAVAATLLIGLAMGGCGRKGALDAPPSAAAVPAPAATAAAPASPTDGFLLFGRPAEPPPPEAPAASSAPSRSFFLDWLVK